MNANGNAYTEGRASAAPSTAGKWPSSGSREKVTFDPPRTPVILTPEKAPTPVEGKFGRQYQWFFEGNQVAWFDPDVNAQLIGIMTGGARQVSITKIVKRGEPPRYEVQGVESREQLVERRIEEIRRMPPAPEAAAPQRSQARPPRVPVESPLEAETRPHPNMMASALATAIEACAEARAIAEASGLCFEATREDIRTLAITIYIQACGGKQR